MPKTEMSTLSSIVTVNYHMKNLTTSETLEDLEDSYLSAKTSLDQTYELKKQELLGGK